MPKIDRKSMRIFGSDSPTNRLGVIGSLRAGTPAFSSDPATLQSLQNYLEGWPSVVMGNNAPAIEDMNSLHFVFSYMLAMLIQEGIPSWSPLDEYFTGNVCIHNGIIFISKVDDNVSNPPSTSPSNWSVYGDSVVTVDGVGNVTYEVTGSEDLIACSGNNTNITIEIDNLSMVVGKQLTIVNRTIGNSTVTLVDSNTSTIISKIYYESTVVLIEGGTILEINRHPYYAPEFANTDISPKTISTPAMGTLIGTITSFNPRGNPAEIFLDGDDGTLGTSFDVYTTGTARIFVTKEYEGIIPAIPPIVIGFCEFGASTGNLRTSPAAIRFFDRANPHGLVTYKVYCDLLSGTISFGKVRISARNL